MKRTFVAVLLLFSLTVGLFAQEEPYATTAAEKEALLKKAEAALLWFRSMDRESRSLTPVTEYRKKIEPLELMQAAVILRDAKQTNTSRMLREMFPFLQPTPAECFSVQERLGDETLQALQEDKEVVQGEQIADSTAKIREGAATFLKESLTPAEQMILYHHPETPSDLMKAIQHLAGGGRASLTRYYIRKALECDFTPEEAARIVDNVGSRSLMNLATHPDFAPLGQELASRIFAAARKYWRDPATLREPLDRLGSDEKGEVAKSVQALWKGADTSIEMLIEKLAETDDDKEIAAIQDFLPSFGLKTSEALTESFRSGHSKLVGRLAKSLAKSLPVNDSFLFYAPMFDERLTPEVRNEIGEIVAQRTGRKPTALQAAVELYQRAKDYSEKRRALKSDADGYVRFWNWNAEESKPTYIRMTPPAAYRTFAWRYASLAHQILPNDPEIDKLYLKSLFERTAHLNSLDTPIGDATELKKDAGELSRLGLESLLSESIASEHFGAARIAAELLGDYPADELLYGSDRTISKTTDKPRALVLAVAAPDRRVRFAALSTIMKLKPTRSYPGSSFVSDALVWFSRSNGQKLVVSAHPRQSVAARIAGHFIPRGYTGETAVTAGEAMRLAVDSPDVELMVIDLTCSKPAVPNVLQAMRQDIRTHDIPIAVMSDNEKVLESGMDHRSLPSMEKFEKQRGDNPFANSLSAIYAPISSDETAKWVDANLFERTGAEPVPATIRLQQARKALQWIKEIAESPTRINHIEDIETVASDAVHSDGRIWDGLELAAVIKSGAMQNLIFNVVAEATYSMELRKEAAEKFKESVGKFGVLLRGKQVQRLYDRYFAGEGDGESAPKESRESLELLDSVLRLIETLPGKKSE